MNPTPTTPLPPDPPRRRRRNSSRVNLVVSFLFPGAIVLALFFFAAREGMLGKELRKIAVTMAPKEKPPEKPKEKPPEPKAEPPKEAPKVAAAPKAAPAAPRQAATPPPAVASAPVAAPPAAAIPAFDFEGGKAVLSTTNVVELYKGQVEYAFRSRWVRPEGVVDDTFTAEVQVRIDPSGRVLGTEWRKGSGHAQWDESVRRAIQQTPSINRPPPKGFPDRFTIRFDVAGESDGDQASVR